MLILTFATHPLRTIFGFILSTYSYLYEPYFGFISSTYSYLYEPYSDLYQVLILTFTNHIRIYIKYLFLPLRTIFGFMSSPYSYLLSGFISSPYSYLYEPYSDLYQVLILTFTNLIRIYIKYLFLPLRTIFGFISSTYSYLANHIRIYIKYLFLRLRTFSDLY